MKNLLTDIAIDKNKTRVGLIGSGILESRSPSMHMSEAQAQGMYLDYHLFDLEEMGLSVDDLPQLLDEIENAGYVGLNITHPCKQRVIEHLDNNSKEVNDLGAVNTIIFGENGRTGHNTDWMGFYNNFIQEFSDVAINRVIQLGAGGAGSAVAYALARIGIKELNIFDIDATKSEQLARRLSRIFENTNIIILDQIDDITNIDGIINTTPVGMKSYPGVPLPDSLLVPSLWIAEVIYFPLETELLRKSRTLGCKTLDGGGMAIYQAAEAFRLFTGKLADTNRMRRIFLST